MVLVGISYSLDLFYKYRKNVRRLYIYLQNTTLDTGIVPPQRNRGCVMNDEYE